MYSLSRWKASIFVLSDWERGSHMEDWVRSLFGLAGGLALFLYGMTTMSRALQQAAGERLRGFLRRVTRTPLTGALAGLAVTSILQSSSATTVMVIGFVSAGLMGLPQAVAVVFGANVGTTMTAQLVAFRLEDWVFPLLFVGVLVWSLARREPTRQLGLAVFGFGLLFDGIEVMSGAMAPLAVSPVFLRWMAEVRRAPLLGLALGTGMTLVVQSSSATIAVLQRAAQQAGPDGIHSVLGLAGACPSCWGTTSAPPLPPSLRRSASRRMPSAPPLPTAASICRGAWSVCWPCRG